MTTFSEKPVLDALAGSFTLALPEVVLVGFACLLFLQGMVIKARAMNWMLAATGLFTAMLVAVVIHLPIQNWFEISLPAWWNEPAPAEGLRFVAPILPGEFAVFVRWLVLGTGTVLLLLSTKEAASGISGEYYGCLLVALAGCSMVARANDLITLFVALEMISIPTYVLLYLPSRTAAGQEAAAKYFLLSILSSAVLLFGFSYLYGVAGSTNLSALVETLAAIQATDASPMAVLAMVLVIAGLSFRLAAVPFHYYAPDVYQGGPTAVIAQLAVLPKIAGFVVLARLLGLTIQPDAAVTFPNNTQIPLMLWVLAAITMTLGNVMALIQDNLKRILAYSGIAHGGYMLLGFVAATATDGRIGLDSVLVYLVAYALMTLGMFAAIIYLGNAETVDDLAGAGRTNPVAAASLAASLLSLIGLPLTAGFSGKLLLFYNLVEVPTTGGLGVMYRVLAVVAAVNAALGAVYYLRMLGVLYLRTPLNSESKAGGVGPLLATFLCVCGTVALGVYPKPLIELARRVAL